GYGDLCAARLSLRIACAGTLAQHDLRTAGGTDRDAAPPRDLGLCSDGCELEALEHGAQHDLHLHHREACPDAAPPPAAEWQPGVGARRPPARALQEALGAE